MLPQAPGLPARPRMRYILNTARGARFQIEKRRLMETPFLRLEQGLLSRHREPYKCRAATHGAGRVQVAINRFKIDSSLSPTMCHDGADRCSSPTLRRQGRSRT